MPGLGYAIDHPDAIAAREKSTNWNMELLAAAAPPLTVPNDLDWDCGPTLNQGDSPECTMFSTTAVRSYQEQIDEHAWKFSDSSAHLGYDWLKAGHGLWPGDGIPPAEGSYPLAVWSMAKLEGIPGADGKARKIKEYYQLQGTPSSAAWIDAQIAVIGTYGPVTVSSAWPNNWWLANNVSGLLPYPAGNAGGHMYVRKGWWLTGPKGSLSSGMSPSGRYWRHRQSWGDYGKTDKFGRTGEFLLPFEADGAYPNLGINEIWKTLDLVDAPQPGGADVVPMADSTPRIVLIPVGTQLFSPDTNAKITLLGGTSPARVYSPFAINATQYAVRISTGGVPQLLRVNKGAVTVVATSPIT